MSTEQEYEIPQVYAALSNVGCVREHNEDSFVAHTPLFVVADGMGGHEAGEVASDIAIKAMVEYAPTSPDKDGLINAVKAANNAVITGAMDGTGRPGMGTTMTAAQVFNDTLLVAQVGDSRAYLLHEGNLQRITRDHSLMAELIEQGRITEEEARTHPQRSVITRALGSDPQVEPDLYVCTVEKGDRLLLCSDGLSSMITDKQIESILATHEDVDDCCNALVNEALAAGGLDNVTVLLVDPFKELVNPAQPPKPKGIRAHIGPIIWALAFVIILACAGGGFYFFAQNSYYVIDQDGYVAVYRGLPGSFAGINVNWLEETTDIPVEKLSAPIQERLASGQSVGSLDEAQELLNSYRMQFETQSSQESSGTSNASNTTSVKADNEKSQG